MRTNPTTLAEKTVAIAQRIAATEGVVTRAELAEEFGRDVASNLDTLIRRGEIVRLTRGKYAAI